MAQKAIREFVGKSILKAQLPKLSNGEVTFNHDMLQITPETDLTAVGKSNSWLASTKLVVKPDQLIKRRGNNSLILLNATWDEVTAWVSERMGKTIDIDGIQGELNTFIVEPFLPHEESDEYYLAMRPLEEEDEILFYRQGGVAVGDVDSKANSLCVRIGKDLQDADIMKLLLEGIKEERKEKISSFIRAVFEVYRSCGFAFLELNPAAWVDDSIVALDIAAKLDDTAHFECSEYWEDCRFPAPFGRTKTDEERYIQKLDEKTGASLKLTVLNPKGLIWTLVAGGGASVVYTDTIADFGHGKEVAIYGEYSGNPSDDETYEYAKTVLKLMTEEPDPEGRPKVLIVGGGIANFTDVAKTFNGINRALREYEEPLKKVGTKIYVRRGGPNYREGLRRIEETSKEIGIPIEVYGPETHMTRIVRMALAA